MSVNIIEDSLFNEYGQSAECEIRQMLISRYLYCLMNRQVLFEIEANLKSILRKHREPFTDVFVDVRLYSIKVWNNYKVIVHIELYGNL